MAMSAAATELPSEPSHSSRDLKRRQPDVDEREDDGKRQRLDHVEEEETGAHAGKDPLDSPAESAQSVQRADSDKPVDDREQRRRSTAVDEKQRGKRLFGALLGNLKQPSDRVSKKRQEIEGRRKAELQRQDNERLEDKQRRLDRLAAHRKNVQKTVDQENMRIRNQNMLNTANFLQTSAEPRLFYRPWDLRADEEERIADQLRDARAQVDSELQSTASREEERQASTLDGDHAEVNNDVQAERVTPTTHQADSESVDDTTQAVKTDNIALAARADDADEVAGAQAKSAKDGSNKPAGASKMESHIDHTDTTSLEPADDSSRRSEVEPGVSSATALHADDEGDHVVEGDEDTVIY